MCEIKKKSLFTKSEKFYVRLENLPWSASHGDILNFFEDVSVPHGGVSIRNKDVIVALENDNDLNRALFKTGETLNGNKVYISELCAKQLRQMYRQNIRRVLRFTQIPQEQGIPIKRIRPTCRSMDESEMFNIFNPEESVSSESESIVRDNVLPYKTKRKIKPTLLEDILNYGSIFRDEFSCSGHCTKKIKLDENIQITSIIAVT